MAATLIRPSRPVLWTAALAALAGLVLTVGRPSADGPGEPPVVCMDGWGVADLVGHLEARGLGLCAVPTWKGGPLVHNAFLTVPGKSFDDLAGLRKEPADLGRWAGVVYCEECPRIEARDLEVLWENCSLRTGLFVFFGDPDLLRRIREALLESPPDGDSGPGSVPGVRAARPRRVLGLTSA